VYTFLTTIPEVLFDYMVRNSGKNQQVGLSSENARKQEPVCSQRTRTRDLTKFSQKLSGPFK
jgi:hypothetical protein